MIRNSAKSIYTIFPGKKKLLKDVVMNGAVSHVSLVSSFMVVLRLLVLNERA